MKWTPFDPEKFGRQKLPAERKCVLLAFAVKTSEVHVAAHCAVGYLRYAAGDAQSPNWVTPGIGGLPTHWCDCLEQPFVMPHWAPMEERGFPARYSGLSEEPNQ